MVFLSASEVGQIIKQCRRDKEVSLRRLAYLCRHRHPEVKLEFRTIWAIEEGRQEISLSQLNAIASVLEVPASIFISATPQREHQTTI